jgi:hypothetical protein
MFNPMKEINKPTGKDYVGSDDLYADVTIGVI